MKKLINFCLMMSLTACYPGNSANMVDITDKVASELPSGRINCSMSVNVDCGGEHLGLIPIILTFDDLKKNESKLGKAIRRRLEAVLGISISLDSVPTEVQIMQRIVQEQTGGFPKELTALIGSYAVEHLKVLQGNAASGAVYQICYPEYVRGILVPAVEKEIKRIEKEEKERVERVAEKERFEKERAEWEARTGYQIGVDHGGMTLGDAKRLYAERMREEQRIRDTAGVTNNNYSINTTPTLGLPSSD